MSRECMFLGSLSRHNKDLEWRTLKPPQRVTALGSWIDRVIALRSRKDHVIALRQISVTALFYLEDSRKIHLWGMRARQSKDARRAPQREGERESELALAPLFICLSLPGPVLCKLGQPGVLFLPEVLNLVLGPSFVLFLRAFPFLVYCHFGLLFPILPTNIGMDHAYKKWARIPKDLRCPKITTLFSKCLYQKTMKRLKGI